MAMASLTSSPPSAPLHFVLVPFLSKGHIIPQIHLARLLSQRNQTVTIFSTPANCTFIRSSLLGTSVTIQELPFPQVEGIPLGVENTEDVPYFSQSLFITFATSLKSMQSSFELALESIIMPVNCIVYDWFLYWVQDSADKFGIPALTINGMSNFANTLYHVARIESSAYSHVISQEELFSFPSFPSVKLAINDFDKKAISLKPPPPAENDDFRVQQKMPDDDPVTDFYIRLVVANLKSKGMIVNSFYELEPRFIDYWNKHCVPRAWCVGPLCLTTNTESRHITRPWLEWLDHKLSHGQQQVLYVSFGSQAYISPQQLNEILKGLEQSNQCFLWLLKRSMAANLSPQLQERVEGKGLILTHWVDQVEILDHGSIYGSLSHCGWNSVTESICAGKPILAMPMIAEQRLNARILVDDFGIGLRMPTILDESVTVRSNDVERLVNEFMTGDAGNQARNKVRQLKEAASLAMNGRGSSWSALNQLIEAVKNGDL